jgi:hypothetical protein
MHARVVLAAVAAGMMGLMVPSLSAQSSVSTRERPRVCAGECSEESAQLARDLARARAELARLATMLAQRGDSLDPGALASVRSELTRAIRSMERLERQTREQQMARVTLKGVPRPTATLAREGWLGVSFSANFEILERPGQPRLFHFMAYPVVESVEPASPARSAGIEVGDILLAFKQKDLREEPIALEQMLTPGARLPVLLRRGDRTRTVTVTVGERPRGTYVPLERAPEPSASPLPPSAIAPPAPVIAPAPVAPATPNIWVYSTSDAISLAGAQMARLPGELREQVGASGGLLVLRVPHSTPASRADLREGDVIVTANGSVIRSSGDLQREFRRAKNRALSLEVVRQRQLVTVKMEW